MQDVSHQALSRAKINLSLEVLARREDGYHELSSILVPISLADRMDFRLTDGTIETCMDCSAVDWEPASPGSSNNLVTRVAKRLREQAGTTAGARIDIEKQIPMGGGLGGGSSNAATALLVLNRLWDCGFTRERLMAIGAELGCDIPALVHGGAVHMTGVGEEVAPVEMASSCDAGWWLVLVNPKFNCSTADMYRRWTPPLTRESPSPNNLRFALQRGETRAVAECISNSLQSVAFHKYPLLEILAEHLMGAGAEAALLSGSGASIFALVGDEAAATGLQREMTTEFGDAVWCCVAQMTPECPMV